MWGSEITEYILNNDPRRVNRVAIYHTIYLFIVLLDDNRSPSEICLRKAGRENGRNQWDIPGRELSVLHESLSDPAERLFKAAVGDNIKLQSRTYLGTVMRPLQWDYSFLFIATASYDVHEAASDFGWWNMKEIQKGMADINGEVLDSVWMAFDRARQLMNDTAIGAADKRRSEDKAKVAKDDDGEFTMGTESIIKRAGRRRGPAKNASGSKRRAGRGKARKPQTRKQDTNLTLASEVVFEEEGLSGVETQETVAQSAQEVESEESEEE